MLWDDQEVINLADTMREEEEGFGLSDAGVRIVSMAYRKGVLTAWMDLYGDMFDEDDAQFAWGIIEDEEIINKEDQNA